MFTFSRELIAASSIPLVLSVLSKGPSYGYDIIKQIRDASDGAVHFADGTLYPVLRKLEDKKLITSEWKIADNEKRRRYYILTESGKEHLKHEKVNWDFMNGLLEKLWKPVVAIA